MENQKPWGYMEVLRLPRAVSKNKKENVKQLSYVDSKVLEIVAKSIEKAENVSKKVTIEWKIDIDKFTETEVTIIAECNVSFNPPMHFQMSCKYEIDYTHEGMTREEIEENMSLHVRPCLSLNTMIMAELSNHLKGHPLVIPPVVREK